MEDRRYWRIFRKEGGEIVVHFDYRMIVLNEEDFAQIGRNIYGESGGRITLIVDSSQYGIIVIQQNMAMKEGLNGYSIEDALETVVQKINLATAQ